MDQKSFTLFELNTFIKRALALNFDQDILVRAEILSLNIKRGHYYLTLIEKDPVSDEINAQINATIWARDVIRIRKTNPDLDSYFLAGHEMLLSGIPVFHERFGLQFKISGIDTSFTRGALDRKKEELILRIQEEDLHTINKLLVLPMAFKRLAVISSRTAAGYIDFTEQLNKNQYGLNFELKLFESVMQGLNLEIQMSEVLDKIEFLHSEFDAVVIIRGGGSKVDLAGFDNYNLSLKLAHFPIPVFTGIGHEIDVSSLDIVAHRSFKTPTAVAEYFIEINSRFLNEIASHVQSIVNITSKKLVEKQHNLTSLMSGINSKAAFRIEKLLYSFESIVISIRQAALLKYNDHQNKLNMMVARITLLDPFSILKKGYVLITQNNKKIKNRSELSLNEITQLHFHDGNISLKISNAEHGKK